jgi:site-specific DNA-methyltransferase (adenine-specific)
MRGEVQGLFADPPDNIGLQYGTYQDHMPDDKYADQLAAWVQMFVSIADTAWISFNARWTLAMGERSQQILRNNPGITCKPCAQTFTFGQHNRHDFGNCHRPLWRFKKSRAPVYPDQIRVESWRQKNGDPRANPNGKVPGDVFDFPRVTGNSTQRRKWIGTQLHEGLVERCILSCTQEGDWVLDPFAGSDTTLRVYKPINRNCIGVEIDPDYCDRIAKEMEINIERLPKELVNRAKKDPRSLPGKKSLLED